MPSRTLCLEALSALVGCKVESTPAGAQLTAQDFVNVVALKEFYKQEGFRELEYPSVGTLSLDEVGEMDFYSSPPALEGGARDALPNSEKILKINADDFFHPEYDYNFTNIKDGDKTFVRGGEQYLRPCGWDRAALRVLNKYDGGDQWLGTGSNAWPVSYHGHRMDGSHGIILAHREEPSRDLPEFLEAAAASLVDPKTRGKGIYSTPDIKIAEKFCTTFKSATDGNRYTVLLQNRINPEKRAECQREGYWLIYVPDGCPDIHVKALVQESLRPYGLLIKRV